jgi:hypothetical protein
MNDPIHKELMEIHKRILGHLDHCRQIYLDYMETIPECKSEAEELKISSYVEKKNLQL